jgi:hypothetical protein
MKKTCICLFLASLLLTLAPVAHTEDDAAKYTDQFTVLTASMSGTGCYMWVRIGKWEYFLQDAGRFHCHVFDVGTVRPGKFGTGLHRGFIYLVGSEGSKEKVYTYQIIQQRQ